MALTKAQMNDASFLASMLEQQKAARTNALRQADVNTQQALRRVKQNNVLNGMQGGYEESTYLRAQGAGNANKAAISAQFDPLIAEYQGYLDRLKQAQAVGYGSGGRPLAQTGGNGMINYQDLGGTQAARDAARAGTISGLRGTGYSPESTGAYLGAVGLSTASGRSPDTTLRFRRGQYTY